MSTTSSFNILLSNDDGYQAPGFKALYDELSALHHVYVMAPDGERSTTSHTLTLRRPLLVTKKAEKYFTCSGYPADCVFLALNHTFKDVKFDLIVSGINSGPNLSQDVYYSGTVAAAREAAFTGITAFSVSLVMERNDPAPHFESAAKVISFLVSKGAHHLLSEHTLLNINVPNLPFDQLKGYEVCELGFRHYDKQVVTDENQEGVVQCRIVGEFNSNCLRPGTDGEVVKNNRVALSPIKLLTNLVDKRGDWENLIDKININ